MQIFERVGNFFREDFSEVTGIYHDGEKIFLAHLTDKVETLEVNFSADADEEISPAEQLAEKVSFLCAKNGWRTSKTALCLQEGESVTFQPDFQNIPAEKIESAIKIWASAQAGEEALYTSTETDGEFWTETISRSAAEEYLAAWEKNSMTLCALTSLPGNFSEPQEKAELAARIAAEKKSPNLLANRLGVWNWKKIFASAAGIFFIGAAIIFGKTFYDFNETQKNLETLKKNLAAQTELSDMKKIFDENISETKKLNELIASQISSQKLNTLILLGKFSNEQISLRRINFSEDSAEIEGQAEKANSIRSYLSRIKSSVAKDARLDKIESEGGKFVFTIRWTFEK